MVEDSIGKKKGGSHPCHNEMEKLNRELLAKQKEMEQVFYAASHDLRTPLLNIKGFSQEIELEINELAKLIRESETIEKVRSDAPDSIQEIRESIAYIQASTRKMDQLINQFLHISRLGRQELKCEHISMDTLVKDILNTMEYQLEEAQAHVELGDLPDCVGDLSMLNQLFTNLLDNAIKYRDSDRRLVIGVSGKKEEGQLIYCVDDNGLGINEEDQQNIFHLFSRAHHHQEGEGVGLAIVKLIGEKHGGRVTLASRQGQGSSFCLHIPASVQPKGASQSKEQT